MPDLNANDVAQKAHAEFDDLLNESILSDYAVNEVDLGTVTVNNKSAVVYIGIRQESE